MLRRLRWLSAVLLISAVAIICIAPDYDLDDTVLPGTVQLKHSPVALITTVRSASLVASLTLIVSGDRAEFALPFALSNTALDILCTRQC